MKKKLWICVFVALAVLIVVALMVLPIHKKEEPQEPAQSSSSIYVKPEVIVPDLSSVDESSAAVNESSTASMPEIILEDSADTEIDREAVILPRLEEPADEGK